jgi:hypothetical protein
MKNYSVGILFDQIFLLVYKKMRFSCLLCLKGRYSPFSRRLSTPSERGGMKSVNLEWRVRFDHSGAGEGISCASAS